MSSHESWNILSQDQSPEEEEEEKVLKAEAEKKLQAERKKKKKKTTKKKTTKKKKQVEEEKQQPEEKKKGIGIETILKSFLIPMTNLKNKSLDLHKMQLSILEAKKNCLDPSKIKNFSKIEKLLLEAVDTSKTPKQRKNQYFQSTRIRIALEMLQQENYIFPKQIIENIINTLMSMLGEI